MSWVLAFGGFAALIILHEAGHFVAAKAVGMRVERFFLFFPPKLVSTTRGETEYGIGAIPLGGFVKITGMNPDEELPPEIAERGYYHQPVWKRIVVIAAGPFVNLVIAFLVLFFLAFGAKEATTLVIGDIEKGTPAAGALESGDRLVAIDGLAVRGEDLSGESQRLSEQINSHDCHDRSAPACTPVQITVERDGRRLQLSVPTFFDEDSDRNRLGFAFNGGGLRDRDLGPGGAAGLALDQMWFVTSKTVEVIVNIVDAEQRKEISGVVGSYEVTRQAIEFSARDALTLLAVISLSLAVINLFPFLPLDGGHIFWSLVEKVRGRPVSFTTMERAGAVGFMLVIMLFIVGLTNDIGRLTGEGFDIR